MTNMDKYFTEEGKKWNEFFSKHELGKFYYNLNGALYIEEEIMDNSIMLQIYKFINENDQWVLGYNKNAGLWYVEQKQNN